MACKKIEWRRYNLRGSGITTINSNVQGENEWLRSTKLKELRSFLGAVNQLDDGIPYLATICFPFRSNLTMYVVWCGTKEHETSFSKYTKRTQKLSNWHIRKERPMRTNCDARDKKLGAIHQQLQNNHNSKLVPFSFRFEMDLKTEYSVIKLGLLAVVWAMEHFSNFVYRVECQILSNHKALSSILRPMETPKDKLLTRARGSMLNVGSEKESERQSNGVSSDSIRQSNNQIKTQWK